MLPTTSRLSIIVTLVALVGYGGTISQAFFSSSPQGGAAQQATPLTAASVALLANNFDAPAIETVRTAISSADPSVRAVAARLAGVMGVAALTGTIWSALEREQDPVVAAEFARALLFLRGAAGAELVESRLDRSSTIAVVYAEWLARMQPERLATQLPMLSARLGDDRSKLNPLVQRGLEKRPESSEQLLRAWLGATTPKAWGSFLQELSMDGMRPGEDKVLIEALSSQDPGIRENTVWAIVIRLAQDQGVPPAVLDAALPASGQAAVPDTASPTWEQFGREVIARRHARKRTPDRAAFLRSEASTHAGDSRALAAIEQITNSERNALKAALGDRFPKQASEVRSSAPVTSTVDAMRTMPIMWPGLLQGLVATTGCRPDGKSPLPGAASVAYRADGRVGRITNATSLPEPCNQVFQALARLAVADAVYRSPMDAPEWLVLPLDPDYVECMSHSDPAASEQGAPEGESAKIDPPRKIRDFKPFYPEQLVKRGVEGTVLLESVINTIGCVTTLRVVRSVDSSLNYAAVHAVSNWRFTPTKLNGREVPVIMTVTVNFTLGR